MRGTSPVRMRCTSEGYRLEGALVSSTRALGVDAAATVRGIGGARGSCRCKVMFVPTVRGVGCVASDRAVIWKGKKDRLTTTIVSRSTSFSWFCTAKKALFCPLSTLTQSTACVSVINALERDRLKDE